MNDRNINKTDLKRSNYKDPCSARQTRSLIVGNKYPSQRPLLIQGNIKRPIHREQRRVEGRLVGFEPNSACGNRLSHHRYPHMNVYLDTHDDASPTPSPHMFTAIYTDQPVAPTFPIQAHTHQASCTLSKTSRSESTIERSIRVRQSENSATCAPLSPKRALKRLAPERPESQTERSIWIQQKQSQ